MVAWGVPTARPRMHCLHHDLYGRWPSSRCRVFNLDSSVDRSLPLERTHGCGRNCFRLRSSFGWERYAPNCTVSMPPGCVATSCGGIPRRVVTPCHTTRKPRTRPRSTKESRFNWRSVAVQEVFREDTGHPWSRRPSGQVRTAAGTLYIRCAVSCAKC